MCKKMILVVILLLTIVTLLSFFYFNKDTNRQVRPEKPNKFNNDRADISTMQISIESPPKALKVPGSNSKQNIVLPEQKGFREFEDEILDNISDVTMNLLENPRHPGREKIQKQMREENFQETFLNITQNNNFAMLIPLMGSTGFMPGDYISDVKMVTKMERVRKLLEDANENPIETADYLAAQIAELSGKYDEKYQSYIKEMNKLSPEEMVSQQLPEHLQTSILCSTAIYVLSQIEGAGDLPFSELAKFYVQNANKDNHSPIDNTFLFYAMHCAAEKLDTSNLSTKSQQIYREYLRKVGLTKIPLPTKIKVTTSQAYYHEDDYRRKIPGNKIEINTQPQITLTRFPAIKTKELRKIRPLTATLYEIASSM